MARAPTQASPGPAPALLRLDGAVRRLEAVADARATERAAGAEAVAASERDVAELKSEIAGLRGVRDEAAAERLGRETALGRLDTAIARLKAIAEG